MSSPRLEGDCFETNSYRDKKSTSCLSSTPCMPALPDNAGELDIDHVEMTEDQRKKLDEVLADISALTINLQTPEDHQEMFCPEILNCDISWLKSSQTYLVQINLVSRPDKEKDTAEPKSKPKGMRPIQFMIIKIQVAHVFFAMERHIYIII